MKKAVTLIIAIGVLWVSGHAQDDSHLDNSVVAPSCQSLEYLTELFLYMGTPLNQNQGSDNQAIILINHGYVVGFSKKHNQPLWAGYEVGDAYKDVGYERPHFFHDDIRLPEENRIGTETFGSGYDRGHMVPNSAINRQYGKLSQMETFLMSNICPQKGKELNQGIWHTLEKKIMEYAKPKEHIWVLCGPIFSSNPEQIERPNGSKVSIPDAFYMILVDPLEYPYTVDKTAFIAFEFPQNPSSQSLNDYLTSVDQIEKKTKLNFFPRLDAEDQKLAEQKTETQIW